MGAHWKLRETLFSAYGLKITLPGAWQLRPGDDPLRWFYRSADKREQLTIIHAEGDEAALGKAAARHRRAVELGFSRIPGLELSQTCFEECEGFPCAEFSGGVEGVASIHSRVVCAAGAIWTFHYENFRLSEAETQERARHIFDSLSARG